jgi:hypothetical protein
LFAHGTRFSVTMSLFSAMDHSNKDGMLR